MNKYAVIKMQQRRLFGCAKTKNNRLCGAVAWVALLVCQI